jgi:membrane protein YqaA with SNARE-associated domain
MQWLKNLYNWVLEWSNSKWGAFALFLLAFTEASFFPIPPDVLLIALCLGSRSKSLYFVAICSLGSALGAIFGYSIGYFLWWNGSQEFSQFANFFFNIIPGFSTEIFFDIKQKYEEWNFWVIFVSGFTPIPFKVFTVSAGAFNINFNLFLIASLIARSARFLIIGGLIWKFGEPIRSFIDKYFNILAFLFSFLLVGSFFIIKYLL